MAIWTETPEIDGYSVVARQPVAVFTYAGQGTEQRAALPAGFIARLTGAGGVVVDADSAMRHDARPAHTRRTTTPTARTRPTRTSAPSTPTTVPAGTDPSSNRGLMTSSVMRPTISADITVHSANTAAPPTAVKKSRLWPRSRARTRRNACRHTPGGLWG